MVEHIKTDVFTPLWSLPDDAVPHEEQARRLNVFRVGTLEMVDRDCSQVVEWCELWKGKQLYVGFAPTWDAFCADILQVDPAWIDKVCEGLRLLRAEGHAGQVTTREALARSAQMLAADTTVTALSAHGEVGRGRRDYDVISNGQQGNSQAYLVKRLKRDAPAIAAALAEGQYPSARAAAKAAGIIKDPTPLETLHKVWRKVPPEDRLRFLIEMLTPAERRAISAGLLEDNHG